MMAWSWDGELHVVVLGSRDPTDAEWNRYVAELNTFSVQADRRILIYSAGGGPNGQQRHALTKTFRGHPPVAIVTSSAIMRAMGLMLRALDPNIRVMAPAEEELAFDHLRLTAQQRLRMRSQHERLARQLESRTNPDQPALP